MKNLELLVDPRDVGFDPSEGVVIGENAHRVVLLSD